MNIDIDILCFLIMSHYINHINNIKNRIHVGNIHPNESYVTSNINNRIHSNESFGNNTSIMKNDLISNFADQKPLDKSRIINRMNNICIYYNCNENGCCNKNCKFDHIYYNEVSKRYLSYGLILYRLHNQDQKEFLMIRRKFSYAFEDLIRGHYDLKSNEKIQSMISRLTKDEVNKIKYFLSVLYTESDILVYSLYELLGDDIYNIDNFLQCDDTQKENILSNLFEPPFS